MRPISSLFLLVPVATCWLSMFALGFGGFGAWLTGMGSGLVVSAWAISRERVAA